MEVRKEARRRTEYEDEGPCTIAHEEVDDGGTAPAIAQRNQEFGEWEKKENCFKGHKGGAVTRFDCKVRNRRKVKKKDLGIRKDDEAGGGMRDSTAGVKTHSRDDDYEGIDHDDILREKQDEKWHCNVAIAIV